MHRNNSGTGATRPSPWWWNPRREELWPGTDGAPLKIDTMHLQRVPVADERIGRRIEQQGAQPRRHGGKFLLHNAGRGCVVSLPDKADPRSTP